MKNTLLRLLFWFGLCAAATHAAEDPMIAAVRAADDERQAATISAAPTRLAAILSQDLRYAHSNGKVDDLAGYVKLLTTRAVVYESFEYKERKFVPIGPGAVLMAGRAIVKSVNDGQKVENDLNYLAVWREEGGKWRFLAWQSCKNPPPAAGAK